MVESCEVGGGVAVQDEVVVEGEKFTLQLVGEEDPEDEQSETFQEGIYRRLVAKSKSGFPGAFTPEDLKDKRGRTYIIVTKDGQAQRIIRTPFFNLEILGSMPDVLGQALNVIRDAYSEPEFDLIIGHVNCLEGLRVCHNSTTYFPPGVPLEEMQIVGV